ncbi:MAG TPA: 50S ribosomal protein L17 [Dissulfurispiraceae bacterium]|nr:50S ribosomal protein L17 [Dissulfurispiraceae bacterium]
MNHNVYGRKFGRTANQRKALFRGLISSLFEYERIETTVARAKAIKATAEKLVTFGKRGDLHSKRMVFSYIPNRTVVAKLFAEIAPRFTERNGGYLRIVQTRQRVNDRAPMAIIEFVDYEMTKAKSAEAAEKKDEPKADKKEATKTAPPKKEAKAETRGKKPKAAAKAAVPKKTVEKEAKSE